MKILVYGLNYSPELTGIGKYTGDMCEWLAGRGHDIRVVCALPYYPEWKIPDAYRGRPYRIEDRKGVRIFRSWLLVPRHPGTASRLLHLASFAIFSVPQLLRCLRHWRPDVLINIEPTLLCAPFALLVSRLFGARSLLHIQDFELDAMLGLGMGRVGSLGRRVERRLMRRFDAISTISPSMAERAAAKLGSGRAVLLFPNWVDTDFVKPGYGGDYYRSLWGISPMAKVVLYSGNMGRKQGMEILLDAARRIRDLDEVLFVFVGAGAMVDNLREDALASALGNVRFFPLQPYEKLSELMALGDIHMVVQRRGVADTGLPSKLTTILAAGGNALITTAAHTELGILCQRHPGIARCVEPEDVGALTRALREMLAAVDPHARQVNSVARAYAEENLDRERVLGRFEQDLLRIQ